MDSPEMTLGKARSDERLGEVVTSPTVLVGRALSPGRTGEALMRRTAGNFARYTAGKDKSFADSSHKVKPFAPRPPLHFLSQT